MCICNLANCKCNISVSLFPICFLCIPAAFLPPLPNFHCCLCCPHSLLHMCWLPTSWLISETILSSVHSIYLTGNRGSWEPPLLKLGTHPYFRKKCLVQGVVMLVVPFLVVTVLGSCGFGALASRQPLKRTKSLHHSTKSYFTQLPWPWVNSPLLLYISFFPFWIENPGENPVPGLDGWSCGEIQLQWWPRRWWWINTDGEGNCSISLPLQLQGHREIAKGHEQVRKVRWRTQKVLEGFLPLSRVNEIYLWLCVEGILWRGHVELRDGRT